MRVFLAGIMQGSIPNGSLHAQDYRGRIKQALRSCWTEAEVYDPLADHQDSLAYDDGQAREVFLEHNRMCRQVDLLIAYVPEASMGTAIEMWEARRGGAVVVAISPLSGNWAIRFTSDLVFKDLDSFLSAVESGELKDRFTRLRR